VAWAEYEPGADPKGWHRRVGWSDVQDRNTYRVAGDPTLEYHDGDWPHPAGPPVSVNGCPVRRPEER
jgi:hypothetical protein